MHRSPAGSAYHAGVVTQYVMEELAGIAVRVELASEFRYRKNLLDKNSLVIVISQSGETADSLAALREAKEKGIRTLGDCQCSWKFYCQRSGCGILYTGRPGDFCGHNKGVQRSADCRVRSGAPVCKGSGRH